MVGEEMLAFRGDRHMGYLTIAQICGDPDELLAGYRQSSETMTEVGRDHGLILHAAAKAEGGLLIVNLWPSREGSESASRDQRRLGGIAEHPRDTSQIPPPHNQVDNYVVFGSALKSGRNPSDSG